MLNEGLVLSPHKLLKIKIDTLIFFAQSIGKANPNKPNRGKAKTPDRLIGYKLID